MRIEERLTQYCDLSEWCHARSSCSERVKLLVYVHVNDGFAYTVYRYGDHSAISMRGKLKTSILELS